MQQYYTASCRTIRRPQSGRRRNLEVPKGAELGAASAAGALAEEGSVGEEGRHDISVVGDRNIVQRGDASRDRVGRQEPEDTKHGKSAIVDLHQEALVLLLLGHLLGEAEGVVQVQDPVDVVAEVLEINNGRLAMLGIFGFLSADAVPGSVPALNDIAIPYDGNVMAPFFADGSFFS